MSMDKILSSIYTIIFISCLLTGLITFWITSRYIENHLSESTYYVIDTKKIVDQIKKKYIFDVYKNPKENNEKYVQEAFSRLSSLLSSYNKPIFEKGAIVNEVSANIVDLTPFFMKKLGLKEDRHEGK